ncbi:hypothetical protein [Nocardioides mangrovicus]|nr:hypothetical protein [Nocardioides mangrovicus]
MSAVEVVEHHAGHRLPRRYRRNIALVTALAVVLALITLLG